MLDLVPAVTWQEIACVQFLAQRPYWLQPIDNPFFNTWELEQLDRRGWIEAKEVDLASSPGDEDHPRYEPRGPGFSPLNNHRASGRPDWPSICASFQWASPQPDKWYNRLNTTIRLTLRGRRVAELVGMNHLAEVGLFDDVAYQLQRISAGWRGRDRYVSHLLAIGVKTSQTHYEYEVRDRAIRPVSAAVGHLQGELIPKLALEVDPEFRDELRALARDLDPHAEVPDPEDDDLTHRWRLSWYQVGCEDRVEELVPILFAMQQRSKADPVVTSAPSAADPGSSAAPVEGGSTKPDLSEFRLGQWFDACTRGQISSDGLRKAVARRKLTQSFKDGSFWLHNVGEVMRLNVGASTKIAEKFTAERGRPPDLSGQVRTGPDNALARS